MHSRAAWLGLIVLLTPALAEAAPDNARRGELLYMMKQDCGSCHGLTLKGGLGTPLLPKDLAGREASDLARVILDGVAGTPMPPWRALVSPVEALWMAKALKAGEVLP